jgi:hypothetical protein
MQGVGSAGRGCSQLMAGQSRDGPYVADEHRHGTGLSVRASNNHPSKTFLLYTFLFLPI